MIRSWTTVLVAMTFLMSGCRSLVPGYEVLPVPQSPDVYRAGSPWSEGVGPNGGPITKTVQGKGAQELTAKEEAKARLDIAATFKSWVSGALGLREDSVTALTLRQLSHESVAEMWEVRETGPILWETIQVDSMELTVTEDAAATLSAKGVGTKLTEAIGGSVTFDASSSDNRNYTVKSDRPVIVAIRVAKLGVRTSAGSGQSALSLESASVGQLQPALLGFRVLVQEVDPMDQVAVLRVQNPWLPQFPGVTHSFVKNETWISGKRTVTDGSDKELKNARYVWDSLTVLWSRVLSECQLQCVRQYLLLQPVKSGLKGTL